MKRKIKTVLLLTVLLCSLFSNTTTTTHAAKSSTPKLNRQKLVLGLDETYTLKLKNSKKNVKWSSSNKKIVTVKNGKLTPKKAGTTKITAKTKSKSYTCKVTIFDFSKMTQKQREVVEYALLHVGNPYRYGGSSLTHGTDCSGFTMSVYKKFGYRLSHNAYGQLTGSKRVKVSKNNLKAGDLLFYGSSKRSCGHVALYIGEGKVVHASTPKNGILVSKYNYRHICAAGRVIK